MPQRIAIVIPYFGRWPWWMPFFFRSCATNPDVDWLMFTDCPAPSEVPDNVYITAISYADYCARVSHALGIAFAPPNPYKLCDIKPALGLIHADELVGYDFWAFGDLDVVYGRLRDYFTPHRLADRWLLSTHHRRVSGHLCLIRNDARMRTYFQRIPDWQARFAAHEHFALDEGAFSRLFVRHKNLPDAWRQRLSLVYRSFRHAEFVEAHSTFTLQPDGTKLTPAWWRWHDGVLTNALMGNQSMPYLHFLFWKQHEWANQSMDQLCSDPGLAQSEHWLISATGIAAGG